MIREIKETLRIAPGDADHRETSEYDTLARGEHRALRVLRQRTVPADGTDTAVGDALPVGSPSPTAAFQVTI